MNRLADARWPDLVEARRSALVLPVGSTEQHGPHLPLDTDARIAAAVAERACAARPRSVLAPVLPYGASGEHAGFPGTLSIGSAALCHVVVEVVRHAAADWHGLVVVNGHGGNAAALRQAAATCAAEGRPVHVVHVGAPGLDAHAGRAETSVMLHLHPDRVRVERAEAGVTTPLDRLMPRLVREGVRDVSPNGVLGDPSGANHEEGARLLDVFVERAVAVFDAAVA